MRIYKKKLVRWLNEFVSIVSEVSNEGFKNEVALGKGVILCPADIFEVLKTRRVLEKVGDVFVLSYQGKFGETFVEIRSTEKESGIILKVKGA